ncbi:MAG: DUF1284 domain-containing protein [Catonella sp.]|uniref:DUF1284 domain-containing protein n=1 Tax=Catonella sp. TaxID=2382125 RepID=UPI003FA0B364
MEYKYKIRPHHGMCIAFFKGKGYSEEFTAHMKEMIPILEENPLVYLSVGTDELCSKCPHNACGVCKSADKVGLYDREVLKRCGLSDGMVLPYLDFKKAVYDNILLAGKREEICGDCQWNELCQVITGDMYNNIDNVTIL